MICYVDDFPGRTIYHNRKTYTYFGGTAYLGLQTDAAFQKMFTENIKKYGTNYSASRKSNVRFSVYEKAETFLAGLAGSEACITLSSGYLAGQLLNAYFNNPAYKSFYAPATHVALHRQHTKNYNTFEALEVAITSHIKTQPSITPVLYFDAIDPPRANYPGFKWLKSLPLEKIILVADDAHSLGITGPEGGGIYKKLQSFHSKALIVCGSLGKGFGIQAGGIFGNQFFIDTLLETDMFATSSPAAPGALATFLQAQHIYNEKRKTLLKHITSFIERIHNLSGFQYMKNYPVFTYTDKTLSHHLLQHDIIVTNFKYPNENAGTISKIVLSAHHTGADLLKLITAVNSHPTKPLH